MNRRELLIRVGSVVVAVPAALLVTGCGGDSAPDASLGQTSFQVASDRDAGHGHLLTLQCDDLGNAALQLRSETTNEHDHLIDFTADELVRIGAGETVTKSVTGDHDHTWVITKPAAAC